MKNIEAFKLIGFDMDGTLCYPTQKFDLIFERAFGFPKSKVADVWMNALMQTGPRTGIEAFKAVLPNISEDEAQKKLLRFSALWAKQQMLFEGVVPMLKFLSQMPDVTLVLITNGPSTMQHHVIDYLNIRQYFDRAFTTGDVDMGYNKPDPQCFEKAAKLFHVNADECLFIGDGQVNDYNGAKSALWDARWVSPCNDDKAGSFEDCLALIQPQKTAFKINWCL